MFSYEVHYSLNFPFRLSGASKDICLNMFNSVIPFPPPAEGNLIPCSSVPSAVHPFSFGSFLVPLASLSELILLELSTFTVVIISPRV